MKRQSNLSCSGKGNEVGEVQNLDSEGMTGNET